MFDALLYIATTGCQWRLLPIAFPPVSTVRGYFQGWRTDGRLDEMTRALVGMARLAEGRKRPVVTDTLGLLVGWVGHSAGFQDRDGAPDVLKAVAVRFAMLRPIFADGGQAGPKLRDALKAIGRWTVEIVKRSHIAGGFQGSPPPLGRRTHPCLARTMPPSVKRPEKIHRKRGGPDHHRTHPTRHQASRKGRKTLK